MMKKKWSDAIKWSWWLPKMMKMKLLICLDLKWMKEVNRETQLMEARQRCQSLLLKIMLIHNSNRFNRENLLSLAAHKKRKSQQLFNKLQTLNSYFKLIQLPNPNNYATLKFQTMLSDPQDSNKLPTIISSRLEIMKSDKISNCLNMLHIKEEIKL